MCVLRCRLRCLPLAWVVRRHEVALDALLHVCDGCSGEGAACSQVRSRDLPPPTHSRDESSRSITVRPPTSSHWWFGACGFSGHPMLSYVQASECGVRHVRGQTFLQLGGDVGHTVAMSPVPSFLQPFRAAASSTSTRLSSTLLPGVSATDESELTPEIAFGREHGVLLSQSVSMERTTRQPEVMDAALLSRESSDAVTRCPSTPGLIMGQSGERTDAMGACPTREEPTVVSERSHGGGGSGAEQPGMQNAPVASAPIGSLTGRRLELPSHPEPQSITPFVPSDYPVIHASEIEECLPHKRKLIEAASIHK